MTALVVPADRPRLASALAQVAGGPDVTGVVLRVADGSGGWRRVRWTLSRIPPGSMSSEGASPAAAAVLAVGRDIPDVWSVPDPGGDVDDELVRAVVAAVPMPVFVNDARGRYLFANQAFCGLAGVTGPDDVVGRRADELWPELDQRVAPHALWSASSDRSVAEEEAAVRTSQVTGSRAKAAAERPDAVQPAFHEAAAEQSATLAIGSRVYWVTRRVVAEACAGSPVSIGVGIDVTDRVDAERELAERGHVLQAVLRSCPDIVTIFDGQMQLVHDSASAAALLGTEKAMSVHETLERVHGEDRRRLVDAFDEMLSGARREVHVRYRLRHVDGRWITVDSRARTDLDEMGQVAGVVVVTRDISDFLATEARLRSALAAAEQASFAQGELLSRVSHELRTPLSSILGFAQLLQMEVLPADQAILVDRVLRAGRRLLALVDEVLAVARLDAGHVELDPSAVGLADVLADVAGATGAVVEHLEVPASQLDGVAGPTAALSVWADRRWLRHVLTSLVDVARESVGAGVEHPVTLSAGHGDPDWVQLSIVPEPVEGGPPPGARTVSVLAAGGGIGFARCRYLVEQIGGRLQPATEGHGFELWVARAGSPSTGTHLGSSSTSRTERGRGLSLVVVSDDGDVRELLDELGERRSEVSVRVMGTSSWERVSRGVGTADVVVVDATAGTAGTAGTALDVLAFVARVRYGAGRVPSTSVPAETSSVGGALAEGSLGGSPQGDREGTQDCRSSETVPRVVAVLVADARAELVEPYLASGADACLAKPVDIRTLVELIDAAHAVVS